jgi:hypothetical protein
MSGLPDGFQGQVTTPCLPQAYLTRSAGRPYYPDMTNTLPSYGIWHVTTEGDEEGRTTRDLGVHEGYIDDVAFALASRQFYSLDFELVDTLKWKTLPVSTQANVRLKISTGTWDMLADARVGFFRQMLAGRDVTITKSNYFASVALTRGADGESIARARTAAQRSAALAKLTEVEREVLGLTAEK